MWRNKLRSLFMSAILGMLLLQITVQINAEETRKFIIDYPEPEGIATYNVYNGPSDYMYSCTYIAWCAVMDDGVALPGWGNAGEWYGKARAAGYETHEYGEAPQPGWLLVWRSDPVGAWGHVAYVLDVDYERQTMTIREGGSAYSGNIHGIHKRTITYKDYSISTDWQEKDGRRYNLVREGYICPQPTDKNITSFNKTRRDAISGYYKIRSEYYSSGVVVRSTPADEAGNIVGYLHKNDVVRVQYGGYNAHNSRNMWYRIADGQYSGKYVYAPRMTKTSAPPVTLTFSSSGNRSLEQQTQRSPEP